jgi:hypothetical protein
MREYDTIVCDCTRSEVRIKYEWKYAPNVSAIAVIVLYPLVRNNVGLYESTEWASNEANVGTGNRIFSKHINCALPTLKDTRLCVQSVDGLVNVWFLLFTEKALNVVCSVFFESVACTVFETEYKFGTRRGCTNVVYSIYGVVSIPYLVQVKPMWVQMNLMLSKLTLTFVLKHGEFITERKVIELCLCTIYKHSKWNIEMLAAITFIVELFTWTENGIVKARVWRVVCHWYARYFSIFLTSVGYHAYLNLAIWVFMCLYSLLVLVDPIRMRFVSW